MKPHKTEVYIIKSAFFTKPVNVVTLFANTASLKRSILLHNA